jgi:CheY-like chemotaxis protein
VLALVSAMQKDERLPADVLDDMATIARNIELEARLIDDMLDLTRIVRGKLELRMEAVDIRPIVEHAVKSCCTQEAADKMIICHRELAEDPHVAQVDPARLTQVIWNLLRNAIKFTPAGGHIWIRSRFEDVGGRTWVGLEISDSGIGIDPAVLPRIFGAFEQGDVQITRKFGGLGLGLAISKAIIDLHGGEITAASGGAGKGASFTIRLPLSDVPKARVTAAPFAASFADTPAEAGAHLLLVEDHTDTAQVLARMLRRAGYHVTVARSVAQALAATEAAHISPDETGHMRPVRLVISDLGLPDGSGNDLMRQLRDRYQMRGLALSGFGMEEDLRRSAAAGFAQHLTKPVEVEVLLRAIRELMAEA